MIHVVGTGLDPAGLPPGTAALVERAEVLAGGDRLLSALESHPAERLPIRAPLSGTVEAVDRESRAGRRVVVLADGDPGFFGIGKALIQALGADRIRLHPNVTVLQAAAARLGTSWENIRTVSLHGRTDLWPLRRHLAAGRRVGVYTDRVFSPARIARDLTACGVDGWSMVVIEDLGRSGERIQAFDDLSRARDEAFSELSFALLERRSPAETGLALGLDDDAVLHERGLITKQEIRAAGLSLLRIDPSHVVWDLGAGSGAVALEASFLAREGKVFAVERDPGRVKQIRQNIQRFGAYVVEPVHGDVPGCLEGLPDPDRIFMGGGAGQDGVLEAVLDRLRPGGRIVIHVVLLGSLERARGVLDRAGWSTTVTQVQVQRSRPLCGDLRFEAQNPVFVLTGVRPNAKASHSRKEPSKP
jgi:precorrin-6Y C5,15-methyltransferase (decarboxylating)